MLIEAGDRARPHARLQRRVRQSRRRARRRHHRAARIAGSAGAARSWSRRWSASSPASPISAGAGRPPQGRSTRKAPDVRLAAWIVVTVFGLFIVIALTAGLVFNTVTIALPKMVDERLGDGISLVAVGGIATVVFVCGALAQLAVGRLVEKFPPHLLFAGRRAAAVRRRGLGGLCAPASPCCCRARLRDGGDLRAGDGQRHRDRALHRRRLARPRLCGALLPHLPDRRAPRCR